MSIFSYAVIGNPPYVEYNKKSSLTGKAVSDLYKIKGYKTITCGNLYAFVLERCFFIGNSENYFGMIVPLSVCCGERMKPLREYLLGTFPFLNIANFEIFPSKLFDGAFQRLSILLGSHGAHGTAISRLHRWYSLERSLLFGKIEYQKTNLSEGAMDLFGKVRCRFDETIKEEIKRQGDFPLALKQDSTQKHFLFYQEATNYWMKASMRIPFYSKNGVTDAPAHGRFLYLQSREVSSVVLSIFYSSLFYLWYILFSDGFHLSDQIVKNFPVKKSFFTDDRLADMGELLEKDIKNKSSRTTRNTQHDKIQIECFNISLSKNIINDIDTIIASHYSFPEEVLDFIISYDMKYRMGDEED